MTAIKLLFWVSIGCLTVYNANAPACGLPTNILIADQLIPKSVIERYCNQDEGYTPFLLIRAAVIEDKPVFRIVTVKKDSVERVQSVRLYQFNKDGDEHPDVAGESQAAIDFKGKYPVFKARVKGKETTISFRDQTFEFRMHGFFGVTIKKNLNAEGRINVEGHPSSVLLIRSANKNYWQWILDDGRPVKFLNTSR